MRHGIIYKHHTDGTTRFVTTSGRMYIWAYGAWRFKFQHHESMYSMFRRAARLKDSKVFVASSCKVFMEKRVAFEPIDYQFHDFTGRRMSKSRLLRRSQVTTSQQVAALSHAKESRQRLLTGYQPNIAPTPFYVHKQRPPKKP